MIMLVLLKAFRKVVRNSERIKVDFLHSFFNQCELILVPNTNGIRLFRQTQAFATLLSWVSMLTLEILLLPVIYLLFFTFKPTKLNFWKGQTP